MKIEFTDIDASYTKYHYGNIDGVEFTLIEEYNYNPDNTTFKVVWPDGPPHNYKKLEEAIIEQFNKVEL